MAAKAEYSFQLQREVPLISKGLNGICPPGTKTLKWLISNMDDPAWRSQEFYTWDHKTYTELRFPSTMASPRQTRIESSIKNDYFMSPDDISQITKDKREDSYFDKDEGDYRKCWHERYYFKPERRQPMEVVKVNSTDRIRTAVAKIQKNWDSHWLQSDIKIMLADSPVDIELYDKITSWTSYDSHAAPMAYAKVCHAVLARDFRKYWQDAEEQRLHAEQLQAALLIVRNMRHLYIEQTKRLRSAHRAAEALLPHHPAQTAHSSHPAHTAHARRDSHSAQSAHSHRTQGALSAAITFEALIRVPSVNYGHGSKPIQKGLLAITDASRRTFQATNAACIGDGRGRGFHSRGSTRQASSFQLQTVGSRTRSSDRDKAGSTDNHAKTNDSTAIEARQAAWDT